MSEPLTRSLGDFVSKLRLSAIPTDALSVVHTGFADCVGTMIAGSIEDPPKLLEKALSPPAGDASLYLVGRRMPAPEAAWINGTAAHALDYDDVALRGHPSTVLVPAILAEGGVAQGHRRADGDGLRRRATRCGPTCSAAIPTSTTRRAGIPPVSSAPSAPPRPAPPCAASTPRRRRRRSRSAPRRARAWSRTSAP